METLKAKRLRIIDETATAYTLLSRSTNEHGNCMYFTETSIGCAIGRLIEDKELCKTLDKQKDTSCSGIFHLLPKEIQTLGEKFLDDIQSLHDTKQCWNVNGLTDHGANFVAILKTKYSS